jgi:hypothetical protein
MCSVEPESPVKFPKQGKNRKAAPARINRKRFVVPVRCYHLKPKHGHTKNAKLGVRFARSAIRLVATALLILEIANLLTTHPSPV